MATRLESLKAALADRYHIERELGEGGMATVYLAKDLKHDRSVAIKVLKPEVGAAIGAERFLAEIRTTANLQHPHILALFDSGEADSLLYYVMPYVEGESLADRLDRDRQLPTDEAVHIASAVASALQAAHEQGIVHRDIKPANILISRDEPFVADFGIALALDAAGGGRMTETGTSVGTPHYMSPEQATGDGHIDARSDVYSLACVLYEMLTGEPPFQAPTTQATLARILTERVTPAGSKRPSVPANVDAALARALEKLPADRFRSAREFADALTNPSFTYEGVNAIETGVPVRGTGWSVGVPWALTALLAGAVGWLLLRGPEVDLGASPERVTFIVPIGGVIDDEFTISNDGTVVAEIQGVGLVLRALGDPEVRFIEGSEGNPISPTFSPDGSWIAYADGTVNELRRIPVEGGAPITVLGEIRTMFGGAWGPDDTFVFVPEEAAGLQRVPIAGGVPDTLTTVDSSRGEIGHWWPQFLPDGRHILFNVARAPADSSTIEVLDLETSERHVLLTGGHHGRLLPSGHLAFLRGETLWVAAVDTGDWTVTGDPRPFVDGVAFEGTELHGAYAVSENGTLAYIPASEWRGDLSMVWVDRSGVEQPIAIEAGQYANPRVSPDGQHIAFDRTVRGQRDLWLTDLAEDGTVIRLTGDEAIRLVRPGGSGFLVWMPNGDEMVVALDQPQRGLYLRRWDGTRPSSLIRPSELDERPGSVSPDGRVLAMSQKSTSSDIWFISLDDEFEPRPFRTTGADESAPAFSPDGRWVAYRSDETGRGEVWLEAVPETGGGARRQVSRGGGADPRWASTGELFYRRGDAVMSVSVNLETGAVSAPVELFVGDHTGGYDVSPDGQRFVMLKRLPGDDGANEITVVVNWVDEVVRRLEEN